MELKLLNEHGGGGTTVTVSDALFKREHNGPLVHTLVMSYLSNRRTATRAQKARGEVNKSTRKPWRQKGTGRARAGMASSPLWRGGGKIFPSSPDENFSCKVNRKAYRAGMAAILSQLVREERLQIIESISVDSPKTQRLAEKLKALGFSRGVIIADTVDENLYLSSRNLKDVEVLPVAATNPVSLVRAERVLMTRSAVARIEEMWT